MSMVVTERAGVSGRIGGEIRLTGRFLRYDLFTGVVPPLCMTIGVVVSSGRTERIVLAVPYFLLYLYGFVVGNQLAGEVEDRINKPDRPLVRGLVSRRGAWIRLVVAESAFLAYGLWLGVGVWAAIWVAVTLLHNQFHWAWHWCGKDLIMGIGTFVQLAAAWEIVRPLNETGWLWCTTFGLVMTVLVPLQDLRDQPGDAAVGRRTFPLVFGDRATRWFVAVGFSLLPAATAVTIYREASHPLAGMGIQAVALAICGAIAVRVVTLRRSRQDHLTYRMFGYWYTWTLACSFLVL